MTTPIYYLGKKDCGCITSFSSGRTRAEAAKLVSEMIQEGLTVINTDSDGERLVGQLCDEHFENFLTKPQLNPGLRIALNCLREMKKNKTLRGARVGRMKQDAQGMTCHYKDSYVIIEREHGSGENKYYVISRPLDSNAIEDQRKKGSSITTICSMINVPQSFVHDYGIALLP